MYPTFFFLISVWLSSSVEAQDQGGEWSAFTSMRDMNAVLVDRHLVDQGYGVIVLADHGQHDLPDAGEGENKGRHGTDADEDLLVPCTWA